MAEALERAERHAPYLKALIRREAEGVGPLVADGRFDAALAAALGRHDPARPGASLRSAKAGVHLAVAVADLSGAWSLERVTAALSRAADQAIAFALQAAFAERGVEPAAIQGLAVLGLGKLGSRELNFSSDVDLIVLHDPAVLPCLRSEEPDEAAVRVVRRLAALLSERTPDGYVWRVDLRLRPDPDATPPSLRLGAAETYYQSQAMTWERAAFIRARVVAGDRALGERFLAAIRPFVWRRSLDYSALAEIREVSFRIRDHHGDVERFGPGFDLKRGRGGIREIEFFAQAHQLIFGGREPALQAPATLDALAALAAHGRITAVDAQALAAAYRWLRTLEHRLQMRADQQTHAIPKPAAERRALAGLLGVAQWREVARRTEPHLRRVARRYDRLLAGTEPQERAERVPAEPSDVERWAQAERLADPELFARSVAAWRSGRPRSLRAPEAVMAFEAVLPQLARAVGRGRHGRAGLVRLDSFIQALPSGVQFWRLLLAHPPLARTLARLLGETPVLADQLARRPELIDVVIDPPPPLADVAAALAELPPAPASGEPLEPLLDRVRRWSAERRFRLGLDLIEGRRRPLEVARELSLMAEAAVVRLLEAVTHAFVARHGRVPRSELVVLGLGRLGGQALTPQSDLDLVLVFTGDFRATSDGPQPLGASVYFNRLGQRLVAALSAPTAEGPLYAVDTRLRPQGAQGLLVVSLESFEAYQRDEAETWETMALTRARAIAGAPWARDEVEAALARLLTRPRDPAELRARALDMRRYMEAHKPAAGPWDVKLVKGGLVDIEFIVAVRALASGRRVSPDLDRATAEVAPELRAPHAFLMGLLVLLRLVLPADRTARPDRAALELLVRGCGKKGVRDLKAELDQARRAVLEAWGETFGVRR
ncbi:MAG: bifunctional [glutamate--ammonia ligase]-adenylyl-L-tyrosine phosphorylase/[glutamate--ammonia-ligase] adenylyltransferase [Sphingomonadaceae bacterium]|nr:bifunctional [glutamate--ammonia ligase]-adenylyl-L-tyrosine phosphorylase/[glutamate--ammonia-ligase] adenylyltransferase [Sphingomonadaceae bacterium]MDW8414782.1 bifunctional [glutamate--ammonia ligase]-adenylyl-L-tyrosine phosphorylase/[glutamate--ammonia-ligase] adenylyltransferase [Thermaurantiacus sp.]